MFKNDDNKYPKGGLLYEIRQYTDQISLFTNGSSNEYVFTHIRVPKPLGIMSGGKLVVRLCDLRRVNYITRVSLGETRPMIQDAQVDC